MFVEFICCLCYQRRGYFAVVKKLAIMHADGDWLAVEGVLSKDMTTVGEYLQTW